MLNLVTGPPGYPAAVLIRGVFVEGAHKNGPAKLTKFLGITDRHNRRAAKIESGLWIESANVSIHPPSITTLPRIGIDYASKKWRDMPYRFVLDEQ